MYLAQAGDGEHHHKGQKWEPSGNQSNFAVVNKLTDNTWRGSHPSAVRLSLKMHSYTGPAQVPEDRDPVRHKACRGTSQAGSQCVTGPA